MIEVVPYSQSDKPIWDSIVLGSKNGTLLHRRDFIEYHAERFKDASALIVEDGKIRAVFPCSQHSDVAVSRGGLTYGGLLYGKDLRTKSVVEAVSGLIQFYRSRGMKRLLYKAVPTCFHNYPCQEDLYALFQCNAKLVRRDLSSVIEVASRPPPTESRKSGRRKAINNNLYISESVELSGFYQLLVDVLGRLNAAPTHTELEIKYLMSRFPEQIRIFGAYSELKQLLAGVVAFDFGRAVHTQYLASSEAGRAVGALDYLILDLIDGVFSDKAVFSFGTSMNPGDLSLNEHLVFQKEGFGARGIVHDFYEVELST